jgi:hypothetical protein
VANAFAVFDSLPRTTYAIEAFSAYAQDTWRAGPRVTLTYGLRWEVNPAPRVTGGEVAVVRPAASNPEGAFIPGGQGFYSTMWTNFAPRLGMAFLLRDRQARKTVLRIGGGKFYDLGQDGLEGQGYHGATIVAYENQPIGSFGGGVIQPLPITSGTALGAGSGYKLPYTWQWNLTVEQSFGQQTVSAGYVGAAGRRLIGWTENVGGGVVDNLVLRNDSSSSYHALQMQFNRRLSRRLHMLISYTWSHSIDDLSNGVPTAYIGTPISSYVDPRKRGPSDFDIRHSLSGSVIAALPAPRSRRAAALFRNWTANTLFFARTALPADVLIGGLNDRPDRVPDQPLYLYGSMYPGGKRYNPAAFSIPPPDGAAGNLGRNALNGFGAWQIDVGLHREFRLQERTRLEFRAEAFNICNHPNFANPGSPVAPGHEVLPGNPNFG